ncbi:MAG TPA: DUF3324 domain-containing protein [Lactovum miscens]|uniref:DUF916 and DUF3324 domain-containing protein n=1 Tax=Lactovum miscens TaxID=190387 RepID=UPI002ED9B6F8
MKKNKFFLFFVFLICIIGGGSRVTADSLGFTVAPIFPSNQRATSLGYYDLILSHGETENLQVRLSNATNKSIVVDDYVSSATTAINGAITYSPTGKTADSSLIYNMKDYVSLPEKTRIPSNSSVTVNISIRMPSSLFSGVMAGGLTFKQESAATKDSKSGVSLTNEYQYVIALLMRQNEITVDPDLHFNKVEPGQVNARNVINVNFQNTAMAFLNNMNVHATVVKKDNPNIKYSYDNANMAMAPNSNFDLPIPVSIVGIVSQNQYSKPLQPGTYKISMTVNGQKNNSGPYSAIVDGKSQTYQYQWTYDGSFIITAEQAKTLNHQDQTIKHPDYSFIYWIIIGLLVITTLVIFFILTKRRKKKDEAEKLELAKRLEAAEEELKQVKNLNQSKD